MAMFIVSYRRDAEDVHCTNIAVADGMESVEAEYGECDFIAIRQAKAHEVDDLRRRGCPIVECRRADKPKRMLDRLIARIEDLELDCDEEVYDSLLKIQYAMS